MRNAEKEYSAYDYITVIPADTPFFHDNAYFSPSNNVACIKCGSDFSRYVAEKVEQFGRDIEDKDLIYAVKVRLYDCLKAEDFSWGDKVHIPDYVWDEIINTIWD